tara:strand:- start:347 stop:526 length:180 start_codon:yes stop_codon:yes gene_type:complete
VVVAVILEVAMLLERVHPIKVLREVLGLMALIMQEVEVVVRELLEPLRPQLNVEQVEQD